MRTCSQSAIITTATSVPIRGKNLFYVVIFSFELVHVIKRISNEFSFHMMYYETHCVFYISLPEARGYKTHNSFHNKSYGMKIHLRSYIYCILPPSWVQPEVNLLCDLDHDLWLNTQFITGPFAQVCNFRSSLASCFLNNMVEYVAQNRNKYV